MALIKNEQTDALFRAILKLESVEECYQYFEDLCTVQELASISQRLVVAKYLTEDKVYAVGPLYHALVGVVGNLPS